MGSRRKKYFCGGPQLDPGDRKTSQRKFTLSPLDDNLDSGVFIRKAACCGSSIDTST